ncbi:hypothetical protein FEM48_Zijuj04G0117700 [Ziziphus jujuba var. spinosa]|uniref:Uncharacterized protein n=1 Tax=Ziziphus jujuba var. spinosa TaxID=714518 RepID=A0A978VJP5_ZIZJJ|nr:hypothetical protein FEM48_Zijuj04G0117700 [Ziziphus jujuba var. spinosa]
MLFEKDPKVTHYVNKEGKSPLYMAAEAGYMELFKAMMEHQDGNNPDDIMKQKVVHVYIDGKNGGKTALNIAESFSARMPPFREQLTWQALRHVGAPRAQSTIIDMPIDPQNSKPKENTEEQMQIEIRYAEFYKDSVNT